MKAQTVYFNGPGKCEIREVDVPDPRPGQVQVRCVANGICMMEVAFFTGQETQPDPIAAGHEGVGVVTKVGPGVSGLAEGDWVCCGNWQTVQNVYTSMLHKFDPAPDDPAAYITEPPSCVVTSVHFCRIVPADRVLLMGAGYMGLLNLQAIAHSPISELVVSDMKPANLALAREFGATETVQVGTPEGDARMEALKEQPFDLVVEAAHAEAALRQAASLTRRGGRLCIFSWHHEPRTVDFGEWHAKGLTVVNTAPTIGTDFRLEPMVRAAKLLNAGVFDQHKLITHRHHFTDAQAAMEVAVERPEDYIKGVLTFEE